MSSLGGLSCIGPWFAASTFVISSSLPRSTRYRFFFCELVKSAHFGSVWGGPRLTLLFPLRIPLFKGGEDAMFAQAAGGGGGGGQGEGGQAAVTDAGAGPESAAAAAPVTTAVPGAAPQTSRPSVVAPLSSAFAATAAAAAAADAGDGGESAAPILYGTSHATDERKRGGGLVNYTACVFFSLLFQFIGDGSDERGWGGRTHIVLFASIAVRLY